MRRHRSTRGYTFAELMVAAGIGAFVVMAVYYVFISNTEQFYRQEQNIQMQENMRFALEYLKTDLRNSGRLTVVDGTPASAEAGFCRPTDQLTAVRLENNVVGGETPEILTEAPNSIRPDRIQILVENTGATPLLTRSVNGKKIAIAAPNLQNDEAARDLLNSDVRMNSTFKSGNYLYIVNPLSHQSDLVPIESLGEEGDNKVITLTQDTCINVAQCLGACRVNSVQLIQYAIEVDDADNKKTNLVRTQLDATTQDPMENQRLTLAEFVVDLQIWGTYIRKQGTAWEIPADPQPRDDIGNLAGNEANHFRDDFKHVRAINVLLSVRSPREDRDWIVAPGYENPEERVAGDRIWFDLTDDRRDGLAHVETMVTEIHTPNLFRGS